MRSRAQHTRALAAGSVLNGLLAYLFFVLATRALGAAAAAPVSVLWTYWSFTAAALTFPLQHWIARSVAAHRSEGAVHDALPRVALAVVVASVVTGLLSWLGREALFDRGDLWFPLLFGCVTLGSGFIGIVRGGLSSRHQFFDVAGVLVAENGVRCLAAVVLIIAGAHTSVSFGACLALGSLIGLCWPRSFRFSRESSDGRTESALAFLGAAASGQLIGQAVLTGGPVLLALSGGSAADVTALFAALALFRAPYTLGLGLVSQLTGRLTTLVVERDHEALRRVRLAVTLATAGAVGVAALLGAFAGPAIIPFIFGPQVQFGWLPSMLVAVGSAFALANLVTTISIMAQGRSSAMARAWIVASVAGALAFVAVPEPALGRTCWAFVAAEGVAFLALAAEELRGSARQAPRTVPAGDAVTD
jgi:O-antigen/teichoic acid export membrane protein